MCHSQPGVLRHAVPPPHFFLFPQMGSQRDLQPGLSQGQSQRDGKETRWKEPGPSLTKGSKATCQLGMLTLDCVLGGLTWSRLCPGGLLGYTVGNSTHKFSGQKLNCSEVRQDASAGPVGSSGIRLVLQSYPRLRQGAGTVALQICLSFLDAGCLHERMELG